MLSEAASLFRRAVGPVQPLSESVPRALIEKTQPLPLPRQSALDDAAALRESQTAPFSIEDRIGSGEESAFLRPGLPRRVLTDLRRGRWVAQRALDLHSMNRDEARDAVAGLLAHSLERGIRCVRVIHGKGHGSPGRMPVLKHLLRGWLIQRNEILAFCQAPPRDGGGGALLILLSGTKQGK